MYGFPLTVYLLSGRLTSRFPGVDWMSHDARHLLEMVFGWKANPHFGPLHIASTVVIAGGFWLLASAWRVLYVAQRAGRLAVAGSHQTIRHPQYVASVLIMCGFLLQWPTLVTLAMFPVLVTMYLLLALREKKDSQRAFGAAWQQYAARMPRFVPSIKWLVSTVHGPV